MVKQLWLPFFILLTILGPLDAQSKVSVSNSVNKQVLYQSDLLLYNLRVSASGSVQPEEPPAPNVSGLRFHTQTSSRESRANIVNGRLETSSSVTYSYYYYPTRSGKITIPAQSVRVGSSVYRTNPITVEVKPDISSPPSRPSPSRPQRPSSPSYDPFGSFLPPPPEAEGESYIVCLPETQSVYRSEPAIVSYYLYTTEDVRSLNLTEERDFDGYGKAVFEQPGSLDFERVEYKGRSFRRSLLKRLVLYPHSTGTLKAPEMAGSIRLMTFMYQNRNLSSRPASITVRELPSGAPAGFGGAIGSFAITENYSSQSVRLGEAIVYTVQISGQGNFNQFTAPSMSSDARVQISSPQVRDQLNAGTKGTRILQYTIIPKVKGEIRLPLFKFSWLDSSSGKYLIFSGREAVLSVKPGTSTVTTPELDKMLDKLSMFSRIEREVYPPFRPWHLRWWFWLLAGLMLLSLPVSAVRAKRKQARFRDPVGWKNREAAARLRDSFNQAKSLAASSSKDFYQVAGNCLSAYLAERYDLTAHLGTGELATELASKGLSDDLISQIQQFLTDMQAALFAPSANSDNAIATDLQKLEKIVRALTEAGGKA